MRNIGQSVIRSVPIPFMPIEEQRHIAKRVHAQLASAQTARFAAEAQINETEFLPRTILANAFGRGFRVAGSRTNDGIHTAMVRLGAIAEVQLGKMLSPKSKTGQAPFPYLRNQDVQWGRVNVKDLPTMDFSEQERTKFELCQGDLLVCEGGEPGRCAVWQGEFEPCYFQKALHRIRSRSGQIDMEFLMFWLRHPG
jgi:type I restriction enzyme S subunit